MRKAIAGTTLAAIVLAVPAYALSGNFQWVGYGINVPGSSKCPTYKMNITVTVTGKDVKGIFQQEGRDQRHFETTLDKNNKIKTAAVVGGGGMMDVIGQISDSGSTIKLDGYCKFEGPLVKKQ